MARIGVDDLTMMYKHSIVLYQNKPVYVEHIAGNYNMIVIDMLSQKKMYLQYHDDMFKAPTRRIGFVNVNGSVVYVSRMPVRRYKVGYNSENVVVNSIDVAYPLNKSATREYVMYLRCREIAEAMLNRYPSFKEAMDIAKLFGGACAFDKQFAIDARGYVWYKTYLVGSYNFDTDKLSSINFKEEYQYLLDLLEK